MTEELDKMGGRETFLSGLNCAQSVLTVMGEELGLDQDMACRLGRGLGSGMGRGATCGAVNAAYMLLGHMAPEKKDERENWLRVRAMTQEFDRLFKQKWGSLECRELLGVDPSTPEGLSRALTEGLFLSRCPSFVAHALKLLSQLDGREAGE